ncbi:MAG: hypothetical protein DRI77_10040, partial [Chloroflexi bacterium]
MKIRSLLLAVGLGFGLAVVLLALLASPGPIARADADIYYAREGGSGDCLAATTPCSSVQRAINLAIAPSDEVWVATGIYTENLVITHSVNLRGGWNVSFTAQSPVTYPTVVDGNGAHVVQVDAASAEIELYGFTLTDGKDGLNIDAGAVTVTQVTLSGISRQAVDVDGGDILVQQSVITDIQREGVQVEGGSVVVRDCVLANVGYDASETRAGISVKGGNVRIEHTSLTSATNEGVHILGGIVVLDDVTIAGTGHEGVQVEAGATSVLNCVIHDTLQEGIKISGTHTVDGNLVYDTDEHGIYVHDGAATVINNTVHDTISDAIRIAAGSVVTVDGNIIYNAGDDCIEANGDRVLIANNRVDGCSDHGIKVQGVNQAYINANRVYSANQAHIAGTAGIDLDNAGAFTVTNNIVADANGVSVLVENSAGPHNFIYHNTLVGGSTGLVVSSPLTATLANNIIVSHTVGITATPGAVLAVSRALLWGNGSDPISGTGVITQAPLFVAPAAQDYHILASSPAVNAGIEVGVSRDVDGDPRI